MTVESHTRTHTFLLPLFISSPNTNARTKFIHTRTAPVAFIKHENKVRIPNNNNLAHTINAVTSELDLSPAAAAGA